MTLRLSVFALVFASACTSAQPHRSLSDDEWCDETRRWNSNREQVCEVRETVVTTSRLDVDAGPNGGIKVMSWDRDDTLVRARVVASARTEAAAERLLAETNVEVGSGRVRTSLPRTRNGSSVTVGFEVFVPRETDLALQTVNGGVTVDGVEGRIRAEAVNGGISLSGVAGEVRARTMNGGVSVALSGDAWDGRGLDAQTTNGGISILVPDGYSAELDARTQVGRISTSGFDLPRSRERRGFRVGDRIETTLGRGGAPLRLVTTNGGVSIQQGR